MLLCVDIRSMLACLSSSFSSSSLLSLYRIRSKLEHCYKCEGRQERGTALLGDFRHTVQQHSLKSFLSAQLGNPSAHLPSTYHSHKCWQCLLHRFQMMTRTQLKARTRITSQLLSIPDIAEVVCVEQSQFYETECLNSHLVSSLFNKYTAISCW